MTQGFAFYVEDVNTGFGFGVCSGAGSGAGVSVLSCKWCRFSQCPWCWFWTEVLRLGGIVGKIQNNQPEKWFEGSAFKSSFQYRYF